MKYLYHVALTGVGVYGFPNMLGARSNFQNLDSRDMAQPGCKVSAQCDNPIAVSDSDAAIPAQPNAFTKNSAARSNCGQGHVCNTFDPKDQYVSTSGDHAFISPGYSDRRGPCPGLNAAANHGYLPRNGIATITQTIAGLGELYGMSPDLAGFLAAYAIAFDGDVASQQWSIGGPLPTDILDGVTGTPGGISYSHNNYEGDTSIGRCDAYTNGGDAHSLSIGRWKNAYNSGQQNGDRYTLDTMSRLYARNTVRSVKQNPYYFAPLFSTTLVSPAAYNFVINFMSNHSAAEPGGYLNGKMINEFFGVGGTYPNFVWEKGQERVPDNWYRRPSTQEYDAADVFLDLLPEFLAYPDTFRFGGNTHGTNSYAGIDIANFTGGAYNAQTLFQGNNFACFFFQSLQQAVPLALQGGLNDVASAIALLTQYTPDFAKKLQCNQLGKYDSSVFTKYAGYKYSPSASNSMRENC